MELIRFVRSPKRAHDNFLTFPSFLYSLFLASRSFLFSSSLFPIFFFISFLSFFYVTSFSADSLNFKVKYLTLDCKRAIRLVMHWCKCSSQNMQIWQVSERALSLFLLSQIITMAELKICPSPLHLRSIFVREEEARSERENGGEAANSDSQSETGQSGIGGKDLASSCLCEPSLFKWLVNSCLHVFMVRSLRFKPWRLCLISVTFDQETI